jgi:DNA polymerase-4
MDAFFASVEQRDNPELRGKPVVVGGNTRGVVAAASYEARQFGIRSAMPMRDALRRCPNLCRVPPRMSHYQAASKDVFSVFREFTPMVEGLSLDEAFLDVTESLHAPNKLVAKIASDLDKPDGLVVVTEENLRATLDPLPVQVIPGIGKETLARLRQIPINTVADLRCAHDRDLEPVFGRFARRARDRATGIDDRPVISSRADKSISAEETFDSDLDNRKEMHRHLLRLAERTAGRLRAKELVAGTVQVKIRQSDFTTYTRQRALKPPGNGTDTLYQAATSLLDDWLGEFPGSRIRLLGVGGSELSKDAQPDLFTPAATVGSNQLDQAVDQIRDKFGDLSLGRARTMDPDQIR